MLAVLVDQLWYTDVFSPRRLTTKLGREVMSVVGVERIPSTHDDEQGYGENLG